MPKKKEMLKILLFPITDWFIQLKLVDDFGKSVTHNDTNIDTNFIYKHGENNLHKAIEETEKYLNNKHEINKSTLYNIFAYFFLKNTWLEAEYQQFQLWFSESLAKENNEFLSDEFSLYWEFFHLLQFINEEWYLNASSQLSKLEPKYKWCWSSLYLDWLYYCNVDRLWQSTESDIYRKIKEFKAFSASQEDEMKIFIHNLFDSQNFRSFLQRKKINQIAIVPNNYERPVSFNNIIKEKIIQLYPDIQIINIFKNHIHKTTTQKSIKIFCERLTNADLLFDIEENLDQPQDNNRATLVIDDVFGSGATVNMIAKKIKNIYTDVKIIWFALAGSYRNGFDVINEV